MFDSLMKSSSNLCKSKNQFINPLQSFLKPKDVALKYKSQSATSKLSLKKKNKTQTKILQPKLDKCQNSNFFSRNIVLPNQNSHKVIFQGKFQGIFDGQFKGNFQGKFYTQVKQNKYYTQANSRILCKSQHDKSQNLIHFKPKHCLQIKKVPNRHSSCYIQNLNTPSHIQEKFKFNKTLNSNSFKTHKHSQTLKFQQPIATNNFYYTPDARETYRGTAININHPYQRNIQFINPRFYYLNKANTQINPYQNYPLNEANSYQKTNEFIQNRLPDESLQIRDQNQFRATDQWKKRFKKEESKNNRIKTQEIDENHFKKDNKRAQVNFKDQVMNTSNNCDYQRENQSTYPNIASYYSKKTTPLNQSQNYLNLKFRNQNSFSNFSQQSLPPSKNILKKKDKVKQNFQNSDQLIFRNQTDYLIPKKKPIVSIAKIKIKTDKKINQYTSKENEPRRQIKNKTSPINIISSSKISRSDQQSSQQQKQKKIKAVKTLTQFIDQDVQSYLGSNQAYSQMRNSKVIFSHKKLNANLAKLLMLSQRDFKSNGNIKSEKEMNNEGETNYELVSLKLLKNDINFIQDPNHSIRQQPQKDDSI